jgi:peroxiredoxin
LAGFAKLKAEFDALGASVFAASVDGPDKAAEVAAQLNFPVGHGVTRAHAEALGAWWEERRSIIQPSEFILGTDNKVVGSSYSDGPLGRIDAADVIRLVNFYRSRK